MVKSGFGSKFCTILVQRNDLHFVVVLLHKGTESKSKSLVWTNRPIHGIKLQKNNILNIYMHRFRSAAKKYKHYDNDAWDEDIVKYTF